jgi:hypothetical protein
MPKISNFISSFKKDLARPCNYEVEISLPLTFRTILKGMSFANPALVPLISQINPLSDALNMGKFRCEQAELPPRAFTLVPQKTYGPLEYFPIQNTYNKSAMVFIVGDDMKEKLFFDLWMEMICTTHPSYNYAAGGPSGKGSVRFDFAYKSEYRSDIIVRQFDLTGQPSYSVALRDAFPTEVYSLPLAWGQKDDYHRLNVVFTYRYFYIMNNPYVENV